LDLTHESLIRIWDRLAGWAKNEAKAAEFYGRLSKAAELQAEGAESLWVNPQLALGLQWLADTRPTPAWAERYGPNLHRALAYLKESRQADRNRRIGKMAAVATMVLLVIAIFAVYAAVKASDNAKLRTANKQLKKSNTSLAGQINSLQQQEAEVVVEVAALRTEQAQLTEDITNRTQKITELASQLKVLHTQGDALVLQIHNATEDRNYTLQLLDLFASSNGSAAQDLITFMKHLRQTIDALGDENQHVDQLYEKVIAVGVKLPERPPIALSSPAEELIRPSPPGGESSFQSEPPTASQPPPIALSSPAEALIQPSPGIHVPPDDYLQELLTKNAALLEQAQQLSEATRNLQQEAVLLRQQNKKLNALSTSLREQAALLLGETKTLSSLNDLSQQQLTDVKSVGNKLGNLRTILSSEKDKLHQIHDEAEGAADAVDSQRQLTKQIQIWLSRAIDDAQKKE
jgi:predicted nuclease with TOPRIM domain